MNRMAKYWPDGDEETLRSMNRRGCTDLQIGMVLGKSESAVRSRRQQLGLPSGQRRLPGPTPMGRTCSRCGVVRPEIEFKTYKGRGRTTVCKHCDAKYHDYRRAQERLRESTQVSLAEMRLKMAQDDRDAAVSVEAALEQLRRHQEDVRPILRPREDPR